MAKSTNPLNYYEMKGKLYYFLAALSIIFFIGISDKALAQERILTGKISDAATNQPLPGVNISVPGVTTGTISNVNGEYSIEISGSDVTLVYSFIGYVTQKIPVAENTLLNVSLVEEVISLDELVVVGYGTQKKSDLTGAVSVVKTENLEKVVSSEISKVLQGQVSGVQIHGSGEPGSVAKIKIRGVGSFRNTEPLYVIDGVPIEGAGDFSTSDIESIQVLKDASSCAIYGARGANGVIIITTKRGKKGEMKVTYNGNYGIQNIVKRMDVTNRVQFQEINNLARTNDRGFPAPANDSTNLKFVDSLDTDWQKEALKTGQVTEHNLSLSGGGDNSSYNVMMNYFNQTGTISGPGPKYTRYSFRVNNDTQKGKMKFGQSFYYSYSDKINLTNSQWGNPMIDLVIATPTIPVYDEKNLGGYGGALDAVHKQIIPNIIAFNNLFESESVRNRFLGIIYGEYEFIKGLTYRLNLSYDKTDWRDTYFLPKYFVGDRYRNDIAYMDDTRGDHTIMLMENTLNYKGTFGKHSLGLMAGYTAQYGIWQQISGHAEGYEEPYFHVLDAGPNLPKSVGGTESEHSIVSFLGRLNYSYDDRYLLTTNFRRDGSSRFGSAYRFGNFPSIAAGWKIHNESFFNVDVISALKLRAGYGIIGNEQSVPDYMYDSYINQYANYVLGNGLPAGSIQTQLATSDIHWEQKTTSNIGLDMGMFKNRLEFSADYFYNVSEDLLLQLPIPLSNGSVTDPYINAASMSNKGFEFSATYRKTDGDFHFEISGNATTIKNEVLKLGKLDVPINTYMSNTEVGKPVGELYGWDFIGIFQNTDEVANHAFQAGGTKPGDCIFRDVNGRDAEGNLTGQPDGTINDDDRVYLGSALPKLTGGMNINMDYKGFDLSVFMQGGYGNKMVNGIYSVLNDYKYGNYSTEVYNKYWRGEGSTNQYPRPTISDPNLNNRMSKRWIQDGSYLKIQNLELGYNFSAGILQHIKGVDNFRIYFSIQNLITFTKYGGYDPDVNNDGMLYRGQDYGSYPSPRTFMIGAKLSL